MEKIRLDFGQIIGRFMFEMREYDDQGIDASR